MDISTYRIVDVPGELFYVPNFISEESEKLIIDKVNTAPKPKWVQLKNRRLQNWGGNPTKHGMIPESIPPWLQMFMTQVDDRSVFDGGSLKSNHVLINEYLPGQGIMPHEDGAMFYPTIATINCGSSTVLKFEKKPHEVPQNTTDCNEFQVFLERRSLVVVKGDLYCDYLHSIDEVTADPISSKLCNLSSLSYDEGDVVQRDTRLSLTIRHVLKYCKLKLRLSK